MAGSKTKYPRITRLQVVGRRKVSKCPKKMAVYLISIPSTVSKYPRWVLNPFTPDNPHSKLTLLRIVTVHPRSMVGYRARLVSLKYVYKVSEKTCVRATVWCTLPKNTIIRQLFPLPSPKYCLYMSSCAIIGEVFSDYFNSSTKHTPTHLGFSNCVGVAQH